MNRAKGRMMILVDLTIVAMMISSCAPKSAVSTLASELPSSPAATTSPTITVPSPFGDVPSTRYVTGIEVAEVEDGTAIFDHLNQFGVDFAEGWKAGAMHPDFVPIINQQSQSNDLILVLFNHFLLNDADVIRVFGFDTSTEHLNSNSYLVRVIKVLKDSASLGASLKELADEFIASQPSSELVDFTYRSQEQISSFDVPFIIVMNQVRNESGGVELYSGIILAKTDTAYIQIVTMTNNPDIDLEQELATPAATLGKYVQP